VSLSVFEAAREVPEVPALILDDRVWTWAALAREAHAVAVQLLTRGLPHRDSDALVAVVLRRRPEDAILVHALVACAIPFAPVHPRLTSVEREALLGRLRPRLFVEDARELFGGDAPPVESLPSGPFDPEAPLSVLHTSGTTGRPRGIVLSRRAFLASARASAANLGVRPDDRWLLAMPLSHVGGLSILMRALLDRQPTVLYPEGPFEPASVIDTVDRARVTLLSAVPTTLSRLLDHRPRWRSPAHLRAILLGGAAASPALLARARERGLPVLTTYGLTEACSQVATQRPGTPPGPESGVGVPLPGVEVQIAEGVIRVRGPTLLSGTLPPGEGPALDAEGWLATGDLGRLDEAGRLHVLGRRTELIVTGGENVFPAEVERALEGLEGVRAACVFGRPDAHWGQAVIAAVEGDGLDPEVLGRVLRNRLAAHKLPKRIHVHAALPRTASGKVDRAATARRCADVG